MELKGTKTEKNLWEAFAGESQARNKYTYFASMAKKEGYEQLAAIFEETEDCCEYVSCNNSNDWWNLAFCGFRKTANAVSR